MGAEGSRARMDCRISSLYGSLIDLMRCSASSGESCRTVTAAAADVAAAAKEVAAGECHQGDVLGCNTQLWILQRNNVFRRQQHYQLQNKHHARCTGPGVDVGVYHSRVYDVDDGIETITKALIMTTDCYNSQHLGISVYLIQCH